MRVLGIDPGTSGLGYGVLDHGDGKTLYIAADSLILSPGSPLSQKFLVIFSHLLEIIHQYSPSVIAVENTFLAQNVQTAFKLGQVRAIVLLAAGQRGLPIFEYTPAQVKVAVTGYGAATKDQVQKMVGQILSMPGLFLMIKGQKDATDALAVALCHLHSAKMMQVGRA